VMRHNAPSLERRAFIDDAPSVREASSNNSNISPSSTDLMMILSHGWCLYILSVPLAHNDVSCTEYEAASLDGRSRKGDERRLATAGIGSRCNLRHLRRPVTSHPKTLPCHELINGSSLFLAGPLAVDELWTVSNDFTNLGLLLEKLDPTRHPLVGGLSPPP
jgi:hypothetical protein